MDRPVISPIPSVPVPPPPGAPPSTNAENMYPNSQDPWFGYPTESTFFLPLPPFLPFISITLTFCIAPAPRTRNTGAPPQNNPYGPQINSDSNNTQSNNFHHYPAPHQQQAWGITGRPHVNLDGVPPSTTWPCSSQSLGHNTSIHTGYPFVGQSQAGSQYLDLEPPTTIGGAGHRHSSSEGGITSPQPALLDSDITRGPPIPNSQSITDPSGMGSTYGIPPGGIGVLSQQLNSGGNLPYMGPSLSSESTHGINSSVSNVAVSKPNVTTIVTAEANERRMKTGTTYTCPRCECGTTFFRYSSLKGALCRLLREMGLTCRYRSPAFT